MAVPLSTSTAQRRPSVLVYAGLWFSVTVWGGSFVAARSLLSVTAPGHVALSPTVLAAARFGLAAIFFLPVLVWATARRRVTGGDLLRMALLGQLAYSTYFVLQYIGVQHTNASIASILVVGLIPLATALVSRRAGREALSLFTACALVLGLAGVAAVALQGGLAIGRNAGFLIGALCLVGNAVAFAISTTLSKRWMRTISPLVMTSGTITFGATGLLLFSLADPATNRWGDVLRLAPEQAVALLFLALVCSVAAFFIYNFALTRLPAARAALYIYFEPVVAVIVGAALLGERLSIQTVIGGMLIVASVALIHLAERRPEMVKR